MSALIDETRLITDFPMLEKGGIRIDKEGACAMELVSYVAGEPWTDHPQCACPVLTEYVIALNDTMPYEQRQHLRKYIYSLANSKSDSDVQYRRAYLLADYALRVFVPIEFTEFTLTDEAAQLRALQPIVDQDTARKAVMFCREELYRRENYHLWAAVRGAWFLTTEGRKCFMPFLGQKLTPAYIIPAICAACPVKGKPMERWSLALQVLEEALAIR